MSDTSAEFIGSIPELYDRGLGPVIFVDYAADLTGRVVAAKPARVLELAAGTGILTRMLRHRLPAAADLTATDLNQDMLAIARQKFTGGERIAFQAADAQALVDDDVGCLLQDEPTAAPRKIGTKIDADRSHGAAAAVPGRGPA